MSASLGQRIRHARVERGLSQNTLSDTVGISKAYLSLIETGRVVNPPVDEKLRRIEAVLGFDSGELVHEAHLARTPGDIRAVLATLAGGESAAGRDRLCRGLNLDTAYLSGVLAKAVEARTSNVDPVRLSPVPVINAVSAGQPKDYADLSHPRGAADNYVAVPVDVGDPDAFAARVSGDSMSPKYAPGDVVVFSPAAALRDGDDCFVRLDDGQTTFKRVYFEADAAGGRVARLQPRNAKYDARVVPAEQVSGVFRAVYRVQSLTD